MDIEVGIRNEKKSLLNDGMLDMKIKESLQWLLGNGWPAGNDLQVMKMIYLYHQYCCSHLQRQPLFYFSIFLLLLLLLQILALRILYTSCITRPEHVGKWCFINLYSSGLRFNLKITIQDRLFARHLQVHVHWYSY